MTGKYQNKYRISSARLKNWDYGSNGAYFITICTHDREYFFGKIEHEVMVLNEIGQNATRCFQEIPHHFPFVELGPFVIMPNHVHGIIIINKTWEYQAIAGLDDMGGLMPVETQNIASLQCPKPTPQINKFGPQSGNLASIVRGFKIGVTKFARTINPGFAWQTRYHDHIIRNSESFDRIQHYIIKNPENWDQDTFFNQ